MSIWSLKALSQTTTETAASTAIEVGLYDGASFHLIWDDALTASFVLQTSNEPTPTSWFTEDVTISGAAGYASSVLVHTGNLQSRFARIQSTVVTPAGTLTIYAQAKK